MWASQSEIDAEFRRGTVSDNIGLSIIEAIERAREAQQVNEQRHDVQLEIPKGLDNEFPTW